MKSSLDVECKVSLLPGTMRSSPARGGPAAKAVRTVSSIWRAFDCSDVV